MQNIPGADANIGNRHAARKRSFRILDLHEVITGIAIDPVEHQYAADIPAGVQVFLKDGRRLTLPRDTGSNVHSIVFSPGGRSISYAESDNSARTWSLPEGRELARVYTHGRIFDLAYGHDGKLLLRTDEGVVVWDVLSSIASREERLVPPAGRIIHFTDEELIVHNRFDAKFERYSLSTGALVSSASAPRGLIWTPLSDSGEIVTKQDGALTYWSSRDFSQLKREVVPEGWELRETRHLKPVLVSTDSQAGTISIKFPNQSKLATATIPAESLRLVAISDSGRYAIFLRDENSNAINKANVLDMKTGRAFIAPFNGNAFSMTNLFDFDPEENNLFFVDGKTIYRTNLSGDRHPVSVWYNADRNIYAATISPDGRRIALCGQKSFEILAKNI